MNRSEGGEIMDLINDFKLDFIKKYSEDEYKEVEKLIFLALDYNESFILDDKLWGISTQVEKHNPLQYTYYITLDKEDDEVTLEIESGINNGTIFLDYSLDGDNFKPLSREIEVLKDIEIDWELTKWELNDGEELSDLLKNKVEFVFARYKNEILDYLRKESYDNYVTGGGSLLIDKLYKDKKAFWREKGIFYNCIYETIEVDVNWR